MSINCIALWASLSFFIYLNELFDVEWEQNSSLTT